MSFLVAETGETQRRLTSPAVFLGEIDRELVDDVAGVARQRSEETAVTVHDDEAEARVVF